MFRVGHLEAAGVAVAASNRTPAGMPPSPLPGFACPEARPGGRVVRAGELRKERAEREGRGPAWLDARLAKPACDDDGRLPAKPPGRSSPARTLPPAPCPLEAFSPKVPRKARAGRMGATLAGQLSSRGGAGYRAMPWVRGATEARDAKTGPGSDQACEEAGRGGS
jgi:hypothetical protein